MLKYYNYDITFQEVPCEDMTLCINITNCPHRCKGCHSSFLQTGCGKELTDNEVISIINKYQTISCVSIQGGDCDTVRVNEIAALIKKLGYNVCWYTGFNEIPKDININNFNYIKVGPYIESLGGLDHRTTNQHFYKVENNTLKDITNIFWH